MAHLDEWGLGGRSFGGWITWFLVGGDLYTAYTFVAVPALMFGAGAAGFFAVPYTVVIYPLVFLVLCRLWSVSHRHGFVTPGRLRPRPVRLADAGAARRDHRHRRHHAVHRAAAGRHRGGAQDDGRHRGQRAGPAPADHHRVRDPGRVHVPVRAAGAGADRVRQGLADLPRDHRRGDLPAVQARRLGRRSSTPRTRSSHASPAPGDGILLNANNQLQYVDAGVRLGAGAVPLPAHASPACWPAGTAT